MLSGFRKWIHNITQTAFGINAITVGLLVLAFLGLYPRLPFVVHLFSLGFVFAAIGFHGHFWRCPNCKESLQTKAGLAFPKICRHCGAKLDPQDLASFQLPTDYGVPQAAEALGGGEATKEPDKNREQRDG